MSRLRLFAMACAIALCTGLLGTGSASAGPTPAPEVQNQQLDVAERGAAPPESDVNSGDQFGYTVEEYLQYIIGDLDKVWTQWFTSNGYVEPEVQYHIILENEGAYTSANCRGANSFTADHPNAYYCLQFQDDVGTFHGGELILPVLAFQRMWVGEVL